MRLKPLVFSLCISNGIGIISGILTSQSKQLYDTLVLPPLAPPSIVFPIVWTILFILMGISSYLIYISNSPATKKALIIYCIQLVINFIWPFIFFSLNLYWLSFVWLLVLIFFVIKMIKLFYFINLTASLLQLPYLLWIIFACYLNFMIAMLNNPVH